MVRGTFSVRVFSDGFSGTKIGFCPLLPLLTKVRDPFGPRARGTRSFRSTKSSHHPNAETYVIHRTPERERRGRAYRGTLRADDDVRGLSCMLFRIGNTTLWEDGTLSRPAYFTCAGVCSSARRDDDGIKTTRAPGKSVRTAKTVQYGSYVLVYAFTPS